MVDGIIISNLTKTIAMQRNLLITLLIGSLFFTSCSKSLEDRIVGTWKLNSAWRQKLFGRDYFTTGFESGLFRFDENGNASYTSSTDTLTGYWRSDRYTNSYYNSSGQWETTSMKYLRINLVNYQQNKRLEWDFDDFHFRDGWKGISAMQY